MIGTPGVTHQAKYKHPSVANDARVLRYTRPLKGALSSTVHRGVRKPRPLPGRRLAPALLLRACSQPPHMPIRLTQADEQGRGQGRRCW